MRELRVDIRPIMRQVDLQLHVQARRNIDCEVKCKDGRQQQGKGSMMQFTNCCLDCLIDECGMITSARMLAVAIMDGSGCSHAKYAVPSTED